MASTLDEQANDRVATRVAALVRDFEAAIAARDFVTAVRVADAAVRLAPAPDLIRLLAEAQLALGVFGDALGNFDRIEPGGPDVEAGAILALVGQGRLDEAAGRLDSALRRFAVDPDDRLVSAARSLLLEPIADVAGWVGLRSDGRGWGVARTGARIRLMRDGRATPVKTAASPAEARLQDLNFAIAPGRTDARAEGRVLGAGLVFPPAPRVDGRVRWDGERLVGWVRSGWAPQVAPELWVEAPGGARQRLDISEAVARDGVRTFLAPLSKPFAEAPTLRVFASCGPAGEEDLPDSPVVLAPSRAPRGRRARARRRRPREVCVIVPVHAGLSETLACLASLLATVGPQVEIVVVDDASPDASLRTAVQDLARGGRIGLLRNETNQGFPASVNRAAAVFPDRDLVVLNADAEVYPGWLETLQAVALCNPEAGTITALTNHGSIASYPSPEGPCESPLAADIAQLCASEFGSNSVEIPAGVGCCLYIKRQCFEETGPFDAELFGRGYGEEVDFCRRASARGWKHRLAAGVFVRHIGGVSFGPRRAALLERNMPLLEQRHEGYEQLIGDHIADDPAAAIRRRLDQARLRRRSDPITLIVSMAEEGGVGRFVEARVQALASGGASVAVLRPEREAGRVSLRLHGDQTLRDLSFDALADQAALLALLSELPIVHTELHHFLDIAPSLVEALTASGRPYDVYIHDYVWICPRITLMGADEIYCGEPSLAACETCLICEGGRLEESLTVEALRMRSAHWLAGARRVIAPSRDTADRIERYFPGLHVERTEWEATAAMQVRAASARRGAVRVAVIGAIGDHKGYSVLLSCARDAARRALPLEFVVVGFTQDDDALLATGKVFITGAYVEGELDALLRRENPDLALFASVWPETWCFTLSHALASGVPILAFDIGAIGERVAEAAGPHRLVPHQMAPPALNEALLDHAIANGSGLGQDARFQGGAPPTYQSGGSIERGGNDMARSSSKSRPTSAGEVAAAPAAGRLDITGQVLRLEPGIYRFSVTAATPSAAADSAELMVPAMHIGVGPGCAPGAIEIMTSVRTGATWLYERGDLLLLKVNPPGAPIVLTSICAPGSAPIDVELERVDAAPAGPAAQIAQIAPTRPPPAPSPAVRMRQAAPSRDDSGRAVVPLEVVAHVRKKGDVAFVEGEYAGAPDEDLAIEGFALTPLEELAPHELEYCAISLNGAETAWTSGGNLCGSRGMAIPLVGFAVRLRQGAELSHECAYSGVFKSGAVVGPVSDNGLCVSARRDDLLQGLKVTIVRREPAAAEALAEIVAAPAAAPRPAARFSVFRESLG
ncbi:MAG TPA: glycosyltransferase [Caulobacteraceae bacterium]|nr:glycosyltransferase [Caulobacteraceae bacterium]